MKKVIIPAKTYNMYVGGQRTFIHVKKEKETELKELKFDEKILLVNEENEQEFIEQTFWFLYPFKEVERFVFLAFKWEKNKDIIHNKRIYNAQRILNNCHEKAYNISVISNYQRYLYHQMQAYSSFFFITDDISMPVSHLILEGIKPGEGYVVIDTLKIKTGPQLEGIINVYSMVPISLTYLT
jgi:hypothetical protein